MFWIFKHLAVSLSSLGSIWNFTGAGSYLSLERITGGVKGWLTAAQLRAKCRKKNQTEDGEIKHFVGKIW